MTSSSLSSPFLSEWSAPTDGATSETAPSAEWRGREESGSLSFGAASEFALASPFAVSEAGFELGEAGVSSPTSQLAAEIYHELHDEAFEEALADLAAEATALASEVVVQEAPDAVTTRESVEQQLRDQFEPLARSAEQMLETVGAELESRDPFGLTETEFEQILESAAPVGASPASEGFLSGLRNLAQKAFRNVGSLAQKGIQFVKNVAIGPFVRLLKKAVRPILQAVVKFAMNKVPLPLRGVAAQLARKVLGLLGEAPQEQAPELEALSGMAEADDRAQSLEGVESIGELESDLRAHLTAALLAPDETAAEAVLEAFEADVNTVGEDRLAQYEDARERFVNDLAEGRDLQPAMEQFLPALLALKPALSAALSVIGRERVVRFIAGLISPLLAKFTDQAMAKQLAMYLADAGLSLVAEVPATSAETGGALPLPVARAIAHTVEETVTGLEIGEADVRDESTLAVEVSESFERAAATAMPPQRVRPHLRLAPGVEAFGGRPGRPDERRGAEGINGVFQPVLRPAYLRYTRVPTITITPQMAAAVVLPGGVRLRSFLRDRYGIKPDQAPRVRVHLYQAIPGTSLPGIVVGERRVPGLGPRPRGGLRSAVTKLHPLTVSAAAALLGHPALGRDLPAAYLADRRRTRMGTRYFYLEPLDVSDVEPVPTPVSRPVYLPGPRRAASVQGVQAGGATGNGRANGARAHAMASAPPTVTAAADHRGRQSEVNVRIRLAANEIRVALFLSEPRAQEVSRLISSGAPLPLVLKAVRQVATEMLKTLKQTGPLNHVVIERETLEAESLTLGPLLKIVSDQVLGRLLDWTMSHISDFLRTRASAFLAAADDRKYGVTILVAFREIPLLAAIRQAVRGNPLALASSLSNSAQPAASADVQVVAGFAS